MYYRLKYIAFDGNKYVEDFVDFEIMDLFVNRNVHNWHSYRIINKKGSIKKMLEMKER